MPGSQPTTPSIWANALHAVRLNQQAPPEGLHLGLATVFVVLSALAPLALAGAVRLHILVARHTATAPPDRRSKTVPNRFRRSTARPRGRGPGRTRERRQDSRLIGRPPTADLDELVELARPLFATDETPTRDTVRQTIRTAGHRISQDRLTQVMNALRRSSAEPTGTVPSA